MSGRRADGDIENERVDVIEEPRQPDHVGPNRSSPGVHDWRDVGGGYVECRCGAFGTLDWKWDR